MSRGKPRQSDLLISPWPHRLALLLVCTTFLLILAGGTVTSYEAGMAVEDWPTTRGHWFYPIPRWLTGGWDFFLEQGHRMLAQLAGILTIALAVTLWIKDRRRSTRVLGLAAVAGVIFQIVLGGLRVIGDNVVAWFDGAGAPGMSLVRLIGDEVALKRIHGCTAGLFFSLCAVLMTLTSPAWLQLPAAETHRRCRRLRRLALLLTSGVFLLIVLGTQLRHSYPSGPDSGFEVWSWLRAVNIGLIGTWFQFYLALKLALASLVAAGLAWLALAVLRNARRQSMLVRRVKLLAALFVLQLVLGAAAWVTNYNWPAWFEVYVWEMGYTVVQEGRLQAVLTTLHSACGSLNLVLSLNLTLWLFRLVKPPLRGSTN